MTWHFFIRSLFVEGESKYPLGVEGDCCRVRGDCEDEDCFKLDK